MMQSPLPWAACALVWLSLGASVAWAQQNNEGPAYSPTCHQHTRLVQILKRNYAEAPNALGLQPNGHLLELFVSKESGSWTIISTRPDGLSCVIAAGKHWQDIATPPSEPVA